MAALVKPFCGCFSHGGSSFQQATSSAPQIISPQSNVSLSFLSFNIETN
jgi:hypothetical protein